jgi:hypothetical protein
MPNRPAGRTKQTFLQDIYFTRNFYAKADAQGLTEDHARFVFYEGDNVPGKTNMKTATYKGQTLGIYVFRDEQTNQPVVTSIWVRRSSPSSERHR